MDAPDATSRLRPLERLVQKADFERLLATRWQSRTGHFVVHHLPEGPTQRVWVAPQAVPVHPDGITYPALSTGDAPKHPQPVDESCLPVPPPAPKGGRLVARIAAADRLWIGCVVPKRHARRAVTRNLMRRQIRSAFERAQVHLPPGLWVVRLRAGFPKDTFVSARSEALSRAVRSELDELLAQARKRFRAPRADTAT